MSAAQDDRVAAVRSIYDRWGRGDFDAGTELYDEGTELVLRPEFPDSGRYRGPEEIADYMRQLLSAWQRFAIAASEIRSFGESVVVQVLQSGTGEASGIATELPYYMVWTFDGDRVARIESIAGESEAIAVAQDEERLG